MPKKRYLRPMTPEEMAAMPDEDIDFSDIPELGDDFWKNAVLVRPEHWERKPADDDNPACLPAAPSVKSSK